MNLTNILLNADLINQICGEQSAIVGVWKAVSAVITILCIAVVVLLIVMGTVDMLKAVMAGKDDEIKKAQGILIKRVIAAVIVFFIPLIVKLVLQLIPIEGSNGQATFGQCIDIATK